MDYFFFFFLLGLVPKQAVKTLEGSRSAEPKRGEPEFTPGVKTGTGSPRGVDRLLHFPL